MFLYGLFMKLKQTDEADRYILLRLLDEIIGNKRPLHDLDFISVVADRLYLLNEDGLNHVNRLITDVSELPKYRIQNEGEDD
jgi:hypothetical protein